MLLIACGYTEELPFVRGSAKQGLHAFELADDGSLVRMAVEHPPLTNPTYATSTSDGTQLYVVQETYDKPSTVQCFGVHRSAGTLRLEPRGAAVSTGGSAGCFLTLDAAEAHLLVANYLSGSVACIRRDAADGTLAPGHAAFVQLTGGSGVNAARQEGPHAHHALLDPANRFAYVADLGNDAVQQFAYGAEVGSLTPLSPPSVALPPGSGPRHMVWHPRLPVAYCVNELHSTVVALHQDPSSGQLAVQGTPSSTLPAGHPTGDGDSTCAALRISADGALLYCSNRGHDTVAVLTLHPDTGAIAPGPASLSPTGGRTPRDFILLPEAGLAVAANQDSGEVAVLELRDGAVGRKLASAGAGTPACVLLTA